MFKILVAIIFLISFIEAKPFNLNKPNDLNEVKKPTPAELCNVCYVFAPFARKLIKENHNVYVFSKSTNNIQDVLDKIKFNFSSNNELINFKEEIANKQTFTDTKIEGR